MVRLPGRDERADVPLPLRGPRAGTDPAPARRAAAAGRRPLGRGGADGPRRPDPGRQDDADDPPLRRARRGRRPPSAGTEPQDAGPEARPNMSRRVDPAAAASAAPPRAGDAAARLTDRASV